MPARRSSFPRDGPEALDRLFHALSDRTRRGLLARLTLGPARVTDLAAPFRMSLPAVSKHLRILEEAHLVSRRVEGRVHRLALRGATLREVETWLDAYRSFWSESMNALDRDLIDHPPGANRRTTGQ